MLNVIHIAALYHIALANKVGACCIVGGRNVKVSRIGNQLLCYIAATDERIYRIQKITGGDLFYQFCGLVSAVMGKALPVVV